MVSLGDFESVIVHESNLDTIVELNFKQDGVYLNWNEAVDLRNQLNTLVKD